MISTEKLHDMAPSFHVDCESTVLPATRQDLPFEFREKGGKTFPDQYCHILHCAKLLGPIGVCYWKHDLILDVAYFGRMDLWDRNRPYFNQAISSRMMYDPEYLEGTHCSLMGVWSGNYFHWTLELLPMVKSILKYQYLIDEEVTVLVEHNAPQWVYESLEGYGISNIQPINQMNYTVEILLVPPPGRRDGYTLPGSVRFLQSNNVTPRSTKMVYVSRSDATKRQIKNESEVISFLSGRGFTPVVLSQYDWYDQVSIFKDADFIIGPHGAGLVNLAYCENNPKVIEIGTPEYINPCFYTLAAAVGSDYRLLMGTPQPGENISIELEQLDEAIQRLT